MTFHCPIKGRSLAEWFLEQGRLDEDERAVLSAQVRAWLSTWEVLHVEPGRSIELHDLLTGERRTVIEKLGSICVQPMQVILARVIDLGDDLSVLCGLHPIPLPPREADAVVRKVRQALRKRTRPIEPARLRAETNSRRRADALRSQLEAVAGDLLRHRVREHADVEAALLKQIEFGEAQVPMGERYDVARLRRALGLGDSTSRNAR